MSTRDTVLQDVPICPHCGHRHADAWGWNFGPGLEGSAERECEKCDEPFSCDREVSVYFTTKATGDKP